MGRANQHVFQILTKRSHRLLEVSDKNSWPSNVWMGVTVESQKYVHRIFDLQRVPAKMKFLSIELLLSNIPKLPLNDITGLSSVVSPGRDAELSKSSGFAP